MNEFIEKLIDKIENEAFAVQLEKGIKEPSTLDAMLEKFSVFRIKEIVNKLADEYNNGWIPCSERLPECENKYGWVSCIVSVIRSHYPTSTYDICDAPYDENIVMHANYHVSQKIWHLECDEQVNALIDIEDAPLNCDYVIAWQPLPEPYMQKESSMAKPREYFKFNFSKVVKFDCTCGRRYINTDKCLQETDSRMPQTRADVIRSMNDEELAEFLEQFEVCSHCEYSDKERCTFENPCVHEFATAMALKWLQSEEE